MGICLFLGVSSRCLLFCFLFSDAEDRAKRQLFVNQRIYENSISSLSPDCPPNRGGQIFFKIFVEWGTKFLLLGDKNMKSAAIPCGLVAPGVNK